MKNPRPTIPQPRNASIRHIPLTRGLVAVVDADDYERLMQFKWTANRSASGQFYAMRWKRNGAKVSGYMMHREVMGAPKGSNVDHMNCDPLDNRKRNLRFCTHRENLYNQGVRKNNTTGFKGVSVVRGQFLASISVSGKRVTIGSFDTAQEAGAAYLGAARMVAGEFARAA